MICQICNESDRKYKCPSCKIQYCSVSCFQNHTNKCVKIEEETIITEEKESKIGNYKYHTEDTVPLESLTALESSENLKKILSNKYLRNIITTLDSSSNPNQQLKEAMAEPLFVEYVDECLKNIEPLT